MTVKSRFAIAVVGAVLVCCLATLVRVAGHPVGDSRPSVSEVQSPHLVGSRIAWYCWDKGEPRPHIEDAAYFDHPCDSHELPPVAQ